MDAARFNWVCVTSCKFISTVNYQSDNESGFPGHITIGDMNDKCSGYIITGNSSSERGVGSVILQLM